MRPALDDDYPVINYHNVHPEPHWDEEFLGNVHRTMYGLVQLVEKWTELAHECDAEHRVRALHRNIDYQCRECRTSWPCRTVRTLNGEL